MLKRDIIDTKEIRVFSNVGKHFYNDFIAPKLTDKNIEIYQNSVIYIYSKIDKDYNKDILKRLSWINSLQNKSTTYPNSTHTTQLIVGANNESNTIVVFNGCAAY